MGSGTISIGSLILNSGSTTRFSLAAPGALTNSALQVNGNLTLAGQLDITDLGGMTTNGVYYLIHYTGSLTNNSLSVSAGADWNVAVDTSLTNYVRIIALSRRPQPTCLTLPLMQGQDPQAEFKDGFYNLVESDGCNIHLRRATTLNGLVTAPNPVIYPAGCSNVWAPELHWLSNSWWIYYSVDTGASGDERVHVCQSSGTNPAGPYTQKGVLFTNYWNIDGSVFTAPNGNLYFICSGSPSGIQGIYIAPMSNPYTLAAPLTMLSVPAQSWETHGSVNEGPFGFIHNGQLFIVYSASGCWTDNYCLGLLKYNGGDILSSGAWTKSGPVFAKQPGAYGPGHNSLTVDGSGQWWNLYHANNLSGQGCANLRQLRAQRVFWNSDNTPYFGTPVPLNSVIVEDPDFLVCNFPLSETSGTLASTAGCGPAATLVGSPTWQNPGLKFNGTNDYAELDNTRGNDVQSALTLAAWIKPEALVDWAGIITKGTNTSPYAMQTWHDGSLRFTANFNVPPGSVSGGSWNSNTKLTTGQWYHVAVTYDGNTLRFYINGLLDASQVATTLHFGVADEPITIGADLPGGDEYFKGTIRDVRVYGRALSGAEINAIASINHAPAFTPVLDQTVIAGQTLALTNAVTDPDVPPQTLAYSLTIGPSNATVATLNPTNAVFHWRPRIIDSPSTNPVELVVTDNGTPAISATQNFKVIVLRPVSPAITSSTIQGGNFQFNVTGDAGPDYLVYAATNLTQANWSLLLQTNPPTLPFHFTDPAPTKVFQGFYRVILGP